MLNIEEFLMDLTLFKIIILQSIIPTQAQLLYITPGIYPHIVKTVDGHFISIDFDFPPLYLT